MSRHERAHLDRPVTARDHSVGPEEAPVTLVQYGDYECPSCGRAYPIVKAIQRRLGARLRFVFRNFPLTDAHPHALHAAEAAEAAAKQHRFWEMHDYLYEHQDALDDRHLKQYAHALGLDGKQFEHDLADHTSVHRIEDDFESGLKSGVKGTPTFYVNGAKYEQSWDFDTLLAALETAA